MNWKLRLLRIITNYAKLVKLAVMTMILVITAANGSVTPTGEPDPDDDCIL